MRTVCRRAAALAIALLVALGPTAVGTARGVSISATADSYSVNEDQTLTVDAGSGVLANDSPNTGTCVVAYDDTGLHGSLGPGVASDGSFTFTPDANYNGDTTFTYDMAAGGDCPNTKDDTATVTITVKPVNDPPTISAKNDCADGSVTVNENSGPYPSSQACVHVDSVGPSNESSQTYAWVVVGVASTVGFSSGPSFSKSGNDGFLQFTPSTGQTGDATVTVQAQDSGGTAKGGNDLSNTIDIHIHVIDNPPVANADSFIVLKNTTLNVQAPGVLQNDSDPNGDPITAIKVTNPTHGVVTLASDGSFSYTPASGYEGPDAFSYKASDGTLQSATKVVSLTVTAIPPINPPTPPPPTPVPTDTPPPPTPGPTLAPGETATAAPTLPPFTIAPTELGAAPTDTAAPGATSDTGSSGLSLPVLLVIVLLVLLLAFGAAVFVPGWIRKQTGGAPPRGR